MNKEDTQPLNTQLTGDQAEALLKELATWGNTTTIILQGGSVFEFKGAFPKGEIGHGYYNLTGPVPGFHGHINLNLIHHINFQDKPHRGQESYAFNFQDKDDSNIFKVFLGRTEDGTLIADQVARFKQIKQQLSLRKEQEFP